MGVGAARARGLVALAAALVLLGCGFSGATVGVTWVAAQVEQPAGLVAGESVLPGQFCSPCHGSATILLGATASPFGAFAVGYAQPGPYAAIWRSGDGGRTWSRVGGITAEEGTAIFAVAADRSRVVAVGADHSGAAAWMTADGVRWTRAPHGTSLAGPSGGTAMAAVVAWRGNFVAAGRADDPATGGAAAGVWLSSDGLAWRRVSWDGFAGGEITGIAVGAAAGPGVGTGGSASADADTGADTGARTGRLVAVGTAPPATVAGIEHITSVAWTSDDGVSWRRVTAPALAQGAMRAITAGGPGFVAVGSGAADDRAIAWTSSDGSDWTAVPGGAAFTNYTLPIRIHAVVATGSALVAVGWKSDGGNGSAIAWTSPDGVSWIRAPDVPSFSGGEMDGVTSVAPGLVAVGVTGYPDNDAAFVWTSPR